MDWIWVLLIVVLAAIIVAAVMVAGQRRKAKQAEAADSMRRDADERATAVRENETKAAEVDARARALKADADAKAAEADRLAIAAERQKAAVSEQRSDVQDRLRSADDVDPRVDSKAREDATDSSGADHDHGRVTGTGATTTDRAPQGTTAETVPTEETDHGRSR
jgi:hypothetical protein